MLFFSLVNNQESPSIDLVFLTLEDAKNLDGLIDAIKLTRNLPGVELKQLFVSAMRSVCEENGRDDPHILQSLLEWPYIWISQIFFIGWSKKCKRRKFHWIIDRKGQFSEELPSLGRRIVDFRFLNVHLLSKGLDPFDVELEETRDEELHNDHG